jgi:argininosuccinate lyase
MKSPSRKSLTIALGMWTVQVNSLLALAARQFHVDGLNPFSLAALQYVQQQPSSGPHNASGSI